MAAESNPADAFALAQRIKDIPEGFRARVSAGFGDLAKLDIETRQSTLTDLVAQLARRESISNARLAKAFNISASSAGAIVAATSFTFGVLVDLEAQSEDFVSAGQGVLFAPEVAELARELANVVVVSRSSLKEQLEDSSLASSILPSMSAFGAEVELRFRFDHENKIIRAVPEAVVHLDTDSMNQEVWLQLTKVDIQMLLRRLGEVAIQMDIAAATFEKTREH